MAKILLIDDKVHIPENLRNAIIKKASEFRSEIVIWNFETAEDMKNLYNENIENELYNSNADEDIWKRVLDKLGILMVVVDHDLSALNDVKISESSITNACKQLSIPVCTYHRKPPNTDSQTLKDRVNQSRSFSIEINIDEDNDFQNAAQEIINVFYGFEELKNKISHLEEETLSGGPAKILSSILEKPELESLFTRYTSSSTLAADIIQYNNEEDEDELISETIKSRLPFILGCWLYNYILPFPGIILNNIAAASYINIDPEQLADKFFDEFKDAQYKGPFSNNDIYWWRYDLDQILFDANSENAYEHLLQKNLLEVMPCKCSVSDTSPAGYYCIVRQAPISFEESKGNLSWIPEGADLCRINKKIYRKLAPIMGL